LKNPLLSIFGRFQGCCKKKNLNYYLSYNSRALQRTNAQVPLGIFM
jgi:hypothetical protein